MTRLASHHTTPPDQPRTEPAVTDTPRRIPYVPQLHPGDDLPIIDGPVDCDGRPL